MATTTPAFDFGAASVVEPMMKALSEQFFSASAFKSTSAFAETPEHAAWFGAEMLNFDPAAMMEPGSGREPENPVETWISLFPTAPMFGVKWAFWPLANAMMEPWKEVFGQDFMGAEHFASAAPVSAPAPLGPRASKEKETLSLHGLVRHLEGRSEQPAPPRDEASVVVPLPTRPRAEATTAPVKKATAQPPASKPAAKAPAAKAAPAKSAAAKPAPAKPARAPKARKPKRGADGRPGGLFQKAPAKIDDLKKIRGVGAKLEMVLNDLGIYQYKQIAGFDAEDYAWLDGRLGAFKGRGVRDGWSAQAKDLMK